MTRWNSYAAWLGALGWLAVLGCGDDGGAPPVDAPVGVDGPPVVDAMTPDASGPCPGELVFTGGYEDWDSTPANFDGVEFATVTQVEDPSNMAQTAPNGRVMMCVPNELATFDFVQPDYLDARYTMSPQAQFFGPFTLRGLKPERALELFALELGLTRDVQTAQVLVDIRRYPDDQPALAARASLGNANAGAFTDDGTGRFAPGDQLSFGSLVLFANVEVGDGTTTVEVTAPPGYVCTGPSSISLVAGALAATTFACITP